MKTVGLDSLKIKITFYNSPGYRSLGYVRTVGCTITICVQPIFCNGAASGDFHEWKTRIHGLVPWDLTECAEKSISPSKI